MRELKMKVDSKMASMTELCDRLTQAGIQWTPLGLSETLEAEQAWRRIFGDAFARYPRMKEGSKADYAYSLEKCKGFLIVPFTSNVRGLTISVVHRHLPLEGYRCSGSLIPLGEFSNIEFCVCPDDYSWTMIYTHEDHDLGGPFYTRSEWIS